MIPGEVMQQGFLAAGAYRADDAGAGVKQVKQRLAVAHVVKSESP
jgi:hypothetical protein